MRTEALLQKILTIGCVVVGLLVLIGTISAFFASGIEADLALPTQQIRATGKTQPGGLTATANPVLATVGALPSPVAPTATLVPAATAKPVALLAQDTFSRPNQMFWGTASDGHTWSGDAQSSPSFAIVGQSGQVNGNGTFNAILGPRSANEEVLFTGSISRFGPFNMGAVLRWTDANNWYKAYIDGSQLVLLKRVAGTTMRITSVPFAAQAGTQYSLRFRAAGSTLMARVWSANQAEPTNWQITVTDTALPSGFGGLRLFLVNGAITTITMFSENAVVQG